MRKNNSLNYLGFSANLVNVKWRDVYENVGYVYCRGSCAYCFVLEVRGVWC